MRSVDQSGASSSGIIALSADDSGAISASLLASPEIAEMRKAARRDEEEESLISRCLEGDVEAFRPLVQRYQRLAFSVALRMRAAARSVVARSLSGANRRSNATASVDTEVAWSRSPIAAWRTDRSTSADAYESA